jgi:hypothetical protein
MGSKYNEKVTSYFYDCIAMYMGKLSGDFTGNAEPVRIVYNNLKGLSSSKIINAMSFSIYKFSPCDLFSWKKSCS